MYSEGDTGGATATANLRGALLNAGNGSTLNLTRASIQASNGGEVIVTGDELPGYPPRREPYHRPRRTNGFRP